MKRKKIKATRSQLSENLEIEAVSTRARPRTGTEKNADCNFTSCDDGILFAGAAPFWERMSVSFFILATINHTINFRRKCEVVKSVYWKTFFSFEHNRKCSNACLQ